MYTISCPTFFGALFSFIRGPNAVLMGIIRSKSSIRRILSSILPCLQGVYMPNVKAKSIIFYHFPIKTPQFAGFAGQKQDSLTVNTSLSNNTSPTHFGKSASTLFQHFLNLLFQAHFAPKYHQIFVLKRLRFAQRCCVGPFGPILSSIFRSISSHF